ncbi:hypothetical protein BDB00DRAFT_939896 [Zychaea mexicana]|uniref:uncharacterized protein n=1 Tax=Zychaea mexicana TaxID=64656 RepID=UPI0022FE4474|nr:uncharacterized protein BDB00DRAFT_939896 [Zychaea mexicana]KAI9492103.1 hypothetical protein BDB00DRAFT_939896 [Zychaea mexicana]
MDDLLDLDWSSNKAPPPNIPQKPSYLQGKKRQTDAFGDLLNFDDQSAVTRTPPSQQQQQRPPIMSSSSSSSSLNKNISSLDMMLDPFSKSKKESSPQSLNALKQTKNAEYTSSASSKWNFDLLDSSRNTTPSADPFDVESLASRTTPVIQQQQQQQSLNTDDDNPLGILSMPAVKPKPEPSPSPSPPPTSSSTPIVGYRDDFDDDDNNGAASSPSLSSREKRRGSMDMLIAQMVDMGFEAEQAQVALEATGGRDLQDAVDLLVNNARVMQQQQQQQQRPSPRQRQRGPITDTARARNALFQDDYADEEHEPPMTEKQRLQQQIELEEQYHQQQQQRQQQQGSQPGESSSSSGNVAFQQQKEKLVAQASELGGFLYKNASMFVKTGRERVTKAVGDWQEQQRLERLNREHGRPRWMAEDVMDDEVDQVAAAASRHNAGAGTTGASTKQQEPYMEKFVDDDDSSDEDPALEKQREMEWKRQQEEKRRQYVAQMRKRQQEEERVRQQREAEETYVSPSRRRATPNTSQASSRASPRATPSPSSAAKPAAVPVPHPHRPQRQRPIVSASPDVMARVNQARQRGNEHFKLGQFGDAESAYSQALGALPSGHDHLVLLSNNRAAARLKIGEYKRCIEDCELAIEMALVSGESIESEGVTIRWREQLVKALHRKGDALENIEKFNDAIKTYEELVKLEGSGNVKINQALSRCRKALNPTVSQPQQSSSTTTSTMDDLFGIGSTAAPAATTTRSSPSKPSPRPSKPANVEESKAVAAMRAQAAQQEAEDAERLARTDDVNTRIQNWKSGKENNLRALLATLDTLLWPGAQWRGAQMSELIDPKRCKMTYIKAIAKVHPDKLPASVTVEQRMLASAIFSTLNEAWDSFKTQL